MFHKFLTCQTSFDGGNNAASRNLPTFVSFGLNKKIVSISISPFKTLFFYLSIQLTEHRNCAIKKVLLPIRGLHDFWTGDRIKFFLSLLDEKLGLFFTKFHNCKDLCAQGLNFMFSIVCARILQI